MMKRFFLILFTAAMCICHPSTWLFSDQIKKVEINDTYAFPKEITEQLEGVIDGVMLEHDIPGVMVAVLSGEKKWVGIKGFSDMHNAREANIDDKIRIGSITKTFVVTVLLQLVEEKKLRLESTIDTLLPDVMLPGRDKITVRHLAGMKSGLMDYYSRKGFEEKTYDDPMIKWTPEELVGANISLEFEPGVQWDYSNTNYILLGMIIERITGKTVEEEIRERIIVPLGLNNTKFPTSPAIEGNVMQGYFNWPEGEKLKNFTAIDPSLAWTAGGMISSCNDLMIWAKFFATGKLLHQESFKQMLKWYDIVQSGNISYGLGIFNMSGFLGHGGRIIGYTTAMFYHPIKETTIIVIMNRYDREDDMAFEAFSRMAVVLFPGEFSVE